MAVSFDLSKTPTRVLTSAGLVAAGAAAGTLCTPGLGVSLAAILGGIGPSFLTSDIDRHIQARLNSRDVLRNPDLQRLAGRAIRLVIEAAVDEEPGRFPRQKTAIRKLAKGIPEQWLLIMQAPSWQVGLEQADVGQVPGLLSRFDEDVQQIETLESDTWLAALQAMSDEIKPGRVTDDALEVLADRLHRQYAVAVQELLKKDQSAFVALQMIFFKTILDRLPEASAVPASGDSVEPQVVLDTLKKLHVRSLQIQREWLKKLDKAARQRHAELLHSTKRSLSALGDSIDGLQAGIQQLLDGQKKIQNVAGEARDVAVETLDGVQQLLGRRPSTLPSPADGLPLGLETLPFSRNPNFSGRTEKLAELERALEGSREVAVVQAQAIYGQGGIGKTQLVVEFIHRHLDQFDLVWWVPAETTSTGLGSLAALAKTLDLPEQDQADLDVTVSTVKAELARRNRWLLVLDNVPHPRDADALLPPGGQGHVLITSRDTNWQGRAAGLKLDIFSPEESVAYLRDTTLGHDASPTPAWETAARELTEALGCLPLALAQAAGYIRATGFSVKDYLRLLRDHRQELWEEESELLANGSLTVAGYERSVAETYSLALDVLRQETPAAESLLTLCAFLAPDDIPRRLLESHVGDSLALNRALAALNRVSLADIAADSVSIHRLVQAVCQDGLSAESQRGSTQVALRLVKGLLPQGNDVYHPSAWPGCAELLPHVMTVVRHADPEFWQKLDQNGAVVATAADCSVEAAVNPETVAFTLTVIAQFLMIRVQFAEAEPLKRRALAIDEQSYGAEHPNVAIRLNNLASLLKATNRLGEAEPLMRRALAIDEQSYGAEHPNVAIRLNNLASLLQATNRLSEAEPLMRRALAIFQTSLGVDHPNSQTVARNLELLRDDMIEADQECASRWSVNDVLRRLDQQNRREDRPAIYFLPANQPVASHLNELLEPCASVEETLAELDRQYERDNKPPIWLLPLDEPISPHLDALLGPIDRPLGNLRSNQAGTEACAVGWLRRRRLLKSHTKARRHKGWTVAAVGESDNDSLRALVPSCEPDRDSLSLGGIVELLQARQTASRRAG